ncbi:SCNM1 protein, partial [Sakesphorus luctuosus]|nr:SCNM1 protein [Sakesphorus luctuosus]
VPQRRRVADLLANAIPEDEALLLRSGRFACSVCPHRPVCDTLEALAVHRAGRRHLHILGMALGTLGMALGVGQCQVPAALRCLWGSSHVPCAIPGLAPPGRRRSRSGMRENPGKGQSPRQGPAPGGQVGARGAPVGQDLPHSRGCPPPPTPTAAPPGAPKAAPAGKGRAGMGWDELSPERRRVLRHHLHLRSSGWVQDPSGKWLKDGNAEFDSDEEEPPELPP